MSEINIAFEKYITHKGENIFKLIKTKTNKYVLIDCKTKEIVATNKNNILYKLKEYGNINNLKGE